MFAQNESKMKKLTRIVLYVCLSFGALILITYSSFCAYEHLKGNAYLSYLQANMETQALDTPFSFELMKKDLEQHDLILVGEIHGFEAPTQFDPDFFGLLCREYGVKHYFVEMDYSQAYYLNRYNETGDEELLTSVLQNWEVSAGQHNKDYRTKWQQLRSLYQSSHPFVYVGNNNLSDPALMVQHLQELTLDSTFAEVLEQSDSVLVNHILKKTELPAEQESNAQIRWELEHLRTNMTHYLEGTYREEVLTDNFRDLYQHLALSGKKLYGFYGLGHTLLAPLEGGYRAMANRLTEELPELQGNTLSLNFVFTDSYRVVPSESLPGMLQDEGPYTRFPVSFDDLLTSYLHGIEDLKRVTHPHSKTIVRFTGTDSPYTKSQRLFSMSHVLPVGQLINAAEGYSTADYGQYLIFIRNSDWAEPLLPYLGS